MIQKVLKVGTSAAVTIPKKSLEELGLQIGDKVTVHIDSGKTGKKAITIQPIAVLSSDDAKVAALTLNFINRYRKDLESLAKK